MLSKPQGLVRPEALGKLKKYIHLIGSQTRDFPTCSLFPPPYCIQNEGTTEFWLQPLQPGATHQEVQRFLTRSNDRDEEPIREISMTTPAEP
jgi:hypothetical protein